jgi:Transmembrane amino acid transporter protein
VFVSTLLNFPLVFFGCRDGVANAWHISGDQNMEWLTAGLMIVITLLAAFITDLAVINAVTGGIFATAIVVVFPTIMYSAIVTDEHRRFLWLPRTLCGLGLLMGLLGAYMAI